MMMGKNFGYNKRSIIVYNYNYKFFFVDNIIIECPLYK